MIAITGAVGQWPEVTNAPIIKDGFAMVDAGIRFYAGWSPDSAVL